MAINKRLSGRGRNQPMCMGVFPHVMAHQHSSGQLGSAQWQGARRINRGRKKARSMSGLLVVTWRSAFQVTEYGAADG
ncbi:hypothetical protein, partial [Pseudomonas pergaminensis]